MTDATRLLASRWRRVVGRVVDLVMWSPIVIGFGWVALGSTAARSASDTAKILLSLTATLLSTVLVVVYEVVSTVTVGATLGKKIVGTRIVTDSGDDVDVREMVLRMTPLIATTLLSVVPVLGMLTGPAALLVVFVSFVFLFTDERRQTIWDKTGRTLVVRN